MAVRTWVNVVALNEYLEQIRQYDSLIGKIASESVRQNQLLTLQTQAEVERLAAQNQVLETRLRQIDEDESGKQLIFTIPIALAAVFFVLAVVLFFAFNAKRRSALEKEKQSKDYHKRLYNALEDSERLNIKNNELIHEINDLQSSKKSEKEPVSYDLGSLEEDKLMLENQILEIKKVYDMEVEKRREIEMALEEQIQKAAELEAGTVKLQEIERVEQQLDRLGERNKELEEKMKQYSSKIDAELKKRKDLEKLNQELNLKLGKYAPPNVEDQLGGEVAKTYMELYHANKDLSRELTLTKVNLDSEIETRNGIEEDLGILLNKWKKHLS